MKNSLFLDFDSIKFQFRETTEFCGLHLPFKKQALSKNNCSSLMDTVTGLCSFATKRLRLLAKLSIKKSMFSNLSFRVL